MRFQRGLSLIEVLVTIAIIGTLSAIVLASVRFATDEAHLVETRQEMNSFRNALALYFNQNNSYPADECRNIPPPMNDFLDEGFWPDGSWPDSVYDWDAWDQNGDGVNDTFQLSLRCGACGDKSTDCGYFETTEWDNAGSCNENINSALYFCIRGDCEPHEGDPNTCGKCINGETMPGCKAT